MWPQALIFSSSIEVQRNVPGLVPETPAVPAPEGNRWAVLQGDHCSCPAPPQALGRSHTENTTGAAKNKIVDEFFNLVVLAHRCLFYLIIPCFL